jgi:hypothetical protein
VVTADGTKSVKLFSHKSQKVGWRKLLPILRHDYLGKPERAVREWLKLLNEFDRLDERQAELHAQMRRATDKNSRSRIKSVRKQMDLLVAARQRALAAEAKWSTLRLREAPGQER